MTATAPRTVWVLTFDTAYGTETTLHATEQDAQDALAAWVDHWWDVSGPGADDRGRPATDEEAIAAYFDGNEDETCTVTEAAWPSTAAAPSGDTPKVGSTAISKTVFTFTVLHHTDDHPRDLKHAMSQAQDGDMVGLDSYGATVPVPDGQVGAELRALGSDGSFFGTDLADDNGEGDAA